MWKANPTLRTESCEVDVKLHGTGVDCKTPGGCFKTSLSSAAFQCTLRARDNGVFECLETSITTPPSHLGFAYGATSSSIPEGESAAENGRMVNELITQDLLRLLGCEFLRRLLRK